MKPVIGYIRFFWFFIKQFPHWLFSWKPYYIKYNGQRLVFNPRSIDPFTFLEIYIDEQYDTKTNSPKENIIDVGANIGLYSLWAEKKYNAKKIIAIEMDKKNYEFTNFQMKTNNVGKYVKVINKAFYSKKTKIGEKFFSSYFDSCHQLDAKKKGEIETITLMEIFNLVGEKKVDLIKMDIEGSEKYLISNENSILLRKKVKEVAIEVHPQFGCTYNQMKSFLIKSGFRIFRKRYLNPMMEGGWNDIVIGINNGL